MGFFSRYRWWKSRRRKTEPDTIQRAGEQAEFRLGRFLGAAGSKKGWHIFESLRIPQKEGGHRGEIDFILLHGSDIFTVEQKHWAGTLTIDEDGTFIQNRPNGTVQKHGDVRGKLERKTADLEHHLLQHYDKQTFGLHQWFAFTHPRFEFTNEISPEHMEVLSQKQIVEKLESSVQMPANQALLSTLRTFGTWDEVEVYGGRTYKGDILDHGLSFSLHDLRALDYPLTTISVHHKRSLFSLMTAHPSIVTIPLANRDHEETLSEDQHLRMHVVGDASPMEIPWSQIVKIQLSI